MNDDLISVIIPVYNVKPYLRKCLDSVLNQSYSNIEVIVVDDGSTDGSGAACDCYQSVDHRVRVLHKENGGLAEARNFGLDAAKGQWISFVDSDDWIESDMLEKLLQLAEDHSASISSCAINRIYSENEEKPAHESDEKIIVLDKKQIIEGLLTQEVVRFEVWNKLWSRQMIGDCRFIAGQVSEDVHWDRILYSRADSIVHTTAPLYNYRVSRPGNTQSAFKKARMCVFDEFDTWAEDLKKNGEYDSARIIKSIALNFTVIIYEEAFSYGADKKVMQEMKDRFHQYLMDDPNNEYYDRKIVRFFSFSPPLFCLLLKLKRALYMRSAFVRAKHK